MLRVTILLICLCSIQSLTHAMSTHSGDISQDVRDAFEVLCKQEALAQVRGELSSFVEEAKSEEVTLKSIAAQLRKNAEQIEQVNVQMQDIMPFLDMMEASIYKIAQELEGVKKELLPAPSRQGCPRDEVYRERVFYLKSKDSIIAESYDHDGVKDITVVKILTTNEVACYAAQKTEANRVRVERLKEHIKKFEKNASQFARK